MERIISSTFKRDCRARNVAEIVMLKPILLTALLVASPGAFAAKIGLSGEVTYRERIALPDTAILKIELIDMALPDRPRVSVAAPTGAGQVPLAFTLTFEDSMILPQHSYAINAEIAAGDIRFRNIEPYPITPLDQVDPIVIVTQSVAQVQPSSEQPVAEESLALFGVTWQATSIAAQPVPPGVEITLLVESDMRAGGVGGCNSYFSQAAVTSDSFSVSDLSRTQRSCGYDRNMLEQAYFEALRNARSWSVQGDTLTLLDASGKPTATFRT
jgi:putative lipoprotein